MDTNELLNIRQKTHGLFKDTAFYAQSMKRFVRAAPIQKEEHSEALDQIFTKIARICSGDSNCMEHWADIAGYAKLAEEACRD